MKMLIIGAGFIGRHLVEAAVEAGHSVTILDYRASRNSSGAATARILGDVRDRNLLTSLVPEFECVVNLAGLLGTAETVENPIPSVETNLLGALYLYEAIRSASIAQPIRCVQITVGNHFMNNSYAITKSAAERFALMYNKEHGTKIAVVRALNTYGPHQKAAPVRKVIPNFIAAALARQPIKIFGSGEQIMDMIYVEDVARVLLLAATNPNVPYDMILEAGTGRRTSIKQVAELINEIAASLAGTEHLPMRPGEPVDSEVVGDPHSLRCLGLDAANFVSLEDGLTRTIHWYRQQLVNGS
ncbi:MAG TPA: NAD-dependent epimerase/dehydratase family protein [Chthoniobacterales bacterium]|nr:NAD-dependent epimerase/dehydratase family protein [Chthoniobacterales bacterium]